MVKIYIFFGCVVSVIVRLSDNVSAVFFRADVVRTGQFLCLSVRDLVTGPSFSLQTQTAPSMGAIPKQRAGG